MIRTLPLINPKKELGDFKSYKEVLDFLPSSVWNINSRTQDIKDIFEDDLQKHTAKRTKKGYAVSIQQNFSVFNPILGMNILKIYSKVGDKVIDPFAGRDRALITNYMDRHYLGYEISPKTVKQIRNKIQNWEYLNKKYSCEIKLADGTEVDEPELFDFSFTCPPYWDKEKYESVPGQLSDITNEEDWFSALDAAAINLNNALKKNAYAVIVVADIRKDKKLIPLHSHFLEHFGQVFNVHDIIINKTNPINCSGINGYLKNRVMWKTHEYVLVFKKA